MSANFDSQYTSYTLKPLDAKILDIEKERRGDQKRGLKERWRNTKILIH